MSDLLVRLSAPNGDGSVIRVTPASAGWGHVGFELLRLVAGQSLHRTTGEREVCLVLVAGRAGVGAGGHDWHDLGERAGPFEGKKPFSVYVPAGQAFEVRARTDLELAICSAPGGGSHEVRLIAPDDVAYSVRGKGTNVRHVYDILPETEPAHSLLVVEVITPGGNWSSYPSHKHDTLDLPRESKLEETYYHRIDPPQGFAFQRVYSEDGALDETMCVHDGEVVMVPKGYHPVGAAHGYDLYHLNREDPRPASALRHDVDLGGPVWSRANRRAVRTPAGRMFGSGNLLGAGALARYRVGSQNGSLLRTS